MNMLKVSDGSSSGSATLICRDVKITDFLNGLWCGRVSGLQSVKHIYTAHINIYTSKKTWAKHEISHNGSGTIIAISSSVQLFTFSDKNIKLLLNDQMPK